MLKFDNVTVFLWHKCNALVWCTPGILMIWFSCNFLSCTYWYLLLFLLFVQYSVLLFFIFNKIYHKKVEMVEFWKHCSYHSKTEGGGNALAQLGAAKEEAVVTSGCSAGWHLVYRDWRWTPADWSASFPALGATDEMSDPGVDSRILCLFDVDGTLTAPRQVR